MAKKGKKYVDSAKLIDRAAQYDVTEAMELVIKTATAKFDETVELHVKLGVDSRHADQQVRGAIVLPHGTGKTQRVLVFAKAAKASDNNLTAPLYLYKQALAEQAAGNRTQTAALCERILADYPMSMEASQAEKLLGGVN